MSNVERLPWLNESTWCLNWLHKIINTYSTLYIQNAHTHTHTTTKTQQRTQPRHNTSRSDVIKKVLKRYAKEWKGSNCECTNACSCLNKYGFDGEHYTTVRYSHGITWLAPLWAMAMPWNKYVQAHFVCTLNTESAVRFVKRTPKINFIKTKFLNCCFIQEPKFEKSKPN